MQVQIEAKEVDVSRSEKLGRWKIAKSAEQGWVNRLRYRHQFIDKICDRRIAAPTDDISGDLIDERERENRWMIPARLGGEPDRLSGGFAGHLFIQKTQMLIPGHIDQHAEAVFERQIQKPSGWNKIDSEQVGAELENQSKIRPSRPWATKAFSVVVRRERSIGDSFGMEFKRASSEEFTIQSGPRPSGCSGRRPGSGYEGH